MNEKKQSRSNLIKQSQKNLFNLLQQQHYENFELFLENHHDQGICSITHATSDDHYCANLEKEIGAISVDDDTITPTNPDFDVCVEWPSFDQLLHHVTHPLRKIMKEDLLAIRTRNELIQYLDTYSSVFNAIPLPIEYSSVDLRQAEKDITRENVIVNGVGCEGRLDYDSIILLLQSSILSFTYDDNKATKKVVETILKSASRTWTGGDAYFTVSKLLCNTSTRAIAGVLEGPPIEISIYPNGISTIKTIHVFVIRSNLHTLLAIECVIKETIKFKSNGDIERQRRIVTLQYNNNPDFIGNSPAESIERNLRKVKSLGQKVLHSVKKMIRSNKIYDVIIPNPGPLGITLQSMQDEENRTQIYVEDATDFVKKKKSDHKISRGDILIAVNDINLYNTTLNDAADIIKKAASPRRLKLMKNKVDD